MLKTIIFSPANEMKEKLSTIIFFFIVIVSIESNAQWNYNIITEQEYNDNPFRTSLTEKTFINSVGLSIGNDLDNFSFNIF